jgi:flagellar hook-associated protein 2
MNGVTLTLKDKTTSSITVTINNDTASIQNNIKSFITTYNDVRAYVDSKSIVDQKNPQNNGLFLGDWTTRGITSRLQQLMTGTVTGLTDGYNALNDLGITTDKDGKLSIDDTKLSTNLSANSDSISKIFIGINGVSGLSSMVDVEIDHLISPVGGLIDIRMDGLQERVTGLNDRITVMERRLTSYESTLVRQFSSLERLVGALQMQSNSLGSLRV